MGRLDDLLLLEQAGELPPSMKADLDLLRQAGVVPGQPASLDVVRQSVQSPEGVQARSDLTKPIAQGVGATVGGLAGGVPGAAMGAGMGGMAVDLYRGDIDPMRAGAQAVAGGLTAANPVVRGMSAAKQVLTSGAVQTLSGQVYDAIRGGVTGEWPVDPASSAVGDFAGGVVGESVGRAFQAKQGARAQARAKVEANRARFERQGIEPRASDLLYDTPGMAGASQLEGMAESFPIGRGGPEKLRARRAEQAQLAARRQIQSVSDRGLTTEGQGGAVLAPEVQAGLDRFDLMKDAAFTAVNEITGQDRVVPTTNLRQAAKTLIKLGRLKPIGAPGYTRKVGNLPTETTYEVTGVERMAGAPQRPQGSSSYAGLVGADGQPLQIETTAVGFPERGLGPERAYEGVIVDEAAPIDVLIMEAVENDKIPFWLGRKIEAELGRAFRGQPVGGVEQADGRYLYSAFMRDMDGFFETEVGQQVQPQLAQAKEFYKEGRSFFNDGVARRFLSDSKATAEDMFRAAFEPGNVEKTLDIKGIVPPDVWDAASQAMLERTYARSTVTVGDREVFSPQKFSTEISKYLKNDHLAAIFGEAKAAEIMDTVATFRQMRAAGSPGENPSGSATRFLASKQIEGTAAPAAIAMSQGRPDLAGLSLLGGIGGPVALGALTSRPRGINALVNTLAPPALEYGPEVAGFLNAVAGQGLVPR